MTKEEIKLMAELKSQVDELIALAEKLVKKVDERDRYIKILENILIWRVKKDRERIWAKYS